LSFYDFSIGLRNCSNSVAFFVVHYISSSDFLSVFFKSVWFLLCILAYRAFTHRIISHAFTGCSFNYVTMCFTRRIISHEFTERCFNYFIMCFTCRIITNESTEQYAFFYYFSTFYSRRVIYNESTERYYFFFILPCCLHAGLSPMNPQNGMFLGGPSLPGQ